MCYTFFMIPFCYVPNIVPNLVPELPLYLKKEDVIPYLQNRRKKILLVIVFMLVVFLFVALFMLPKLTSLYENTGAQVLIRFLPYGIGIVGSLYLVLIAHLLYSQINIDPYLNKFKDNEMVDVHQIIDSKPISLAVVLLAVSFLYLVLVILIPVSFIV